MKKLLSAIAVAGLIGTPAFAADMAVKAPPPLPEPVYSWTGFYAGLNAGWSWGKQDTTVNFVPAPTVIGIFLPVGAQFVFSPSPTADQETAHPLGAIGGVQVGYNWQSMSNWIIGIEADFQASGENANVLRIVENNPRDRSQHYRREAGG
jgi:outer membrane immunogenic protein